MAATKNTVHLVNEKGGVICPAKTSTAKMQRTAWDKLDAADRCGNCKRVLARKEGRERIGFGTVSPRASKAKDIKKRVTESPLASYTPRHGQV